MPVQFLELENFKSYAGKQRIGPFTSFTSVIGPNGSGKSNLMDAISFVLGVQSRDLRSHQMRDLIHRPPEATTTSASSRRSTGALSCRVTIVYLHQPQHIHSERNTRNNNEGDDGDDSEESDSLTSDTTIRFSRTINPSGQGSYLVNDKTVSFPEYCRRLESIGVLVQARNFLVFQGDVETLARKSPAELIDLMENVSGSAEFRQEYQEAEQAYQEAEQAVLFGLKQQKGLRQERKLLQQQNPKRNDLTNSSRRRKLYRKNCTFGNSII